MSRGASAPPFRLVQCTGSGIRLIDVLLSLLLDRAQRFSHGASHKLDGGQWLVDCYHCSHQNRATVTLTTSMLKRMLRKVSALLD